ncbi:hypothetical protein WMY93_031081, partial [Mugilogobius chulae]
KGNEIKYQTKTQAEEASVRLFPSSGSSCRRHAECHQPYPSSTTFQGGLTSILYGFRLPTPYDRLSEKALIRPPAFPSTSDLPPGRPRPTRIKEYIRKDRARDSRFFRNTVTGGPIKLESPPLRSHRRSQTRKVVRARAVAVGAARGRNEVLPDQIPRYEDCSGDVQRLTPRPAGCTLVWVRWSW